MPGWQRRPAAALTLGLALAALVAAAACGGGKPAEPPPAPATERATEKPPVLAIGLIPEQNIFRQLQRYQPLADYVGRKAGVRIELRTLVRYGNILDNFRVAQLDGAFFGSFTYALAHRNLGVEAVARPESLEGRSTYHGLVFVRRDSGIREALQLKGRRFAFVDRATTAGFLLPLDYIARAGVKDIPHFLGEIYFAGTHEDVIRDVLDRKADAGAAKNTVFERMAREDRRVVDELAILERGLEVPENALALRRDLDPALRDRIRTALLAMHEDPQGAALLAQFGARRFIPTGTHDYEPVFRYAQEAGIDLATYAYENR